MKKAEKATIERFFGHKKSKSGEVIRMIDVMDIVAGGSQPRRNFDEESISRLADSISRHGFIHPLTVRSVESSKGYSYELIAGERRYRAALLAGFETVPCLVKELSDEASCELAVVENLIREDLNVFEQAEAFRRLTSEHGLSQSELAQRVGLSQSAVANKLRLLRLSERERALILSARLTERHARASLRLDDEEFRYRMLCYVAEQRMSVSLMEEYLDALVAQEAKSPGKTSETAVDPTFHVKQSTDGANKCSRDSLPDLESSEKLFKRAFARFGSSMELASCSGGEEKDGIVTYTVSFRVKQPRSTAKSAETASETA